MKKDYVAVLLEEIRDQNKAVLEAVGGMQRQLADVPKRDEFEELGSEVHTMHIALTDFTTEVRGTQEQTANLDRRVSRLETA